MSAGISPVIGARVTPSIPCPVATATRPVRSHPTFGTPSGLQGRSPDQLRTTFASRVLGIMSEARSPRAPHVANDSLAHAPGTIRTCGLCLRRAALYPLSYGRGSRAESGLAAGHSLER